MATSNISPSLTATLDGFKSKFNFDWFKGCNKKFLNHPYNNNNNSTSFKNYYEVSNTTAEDFTFFDLLNGVKSYDPAGIIYSDLVDITSDMDDMLIDIINLQNKEKANLIDSHIYPNQNYKLFFDDIIKELAEESKTAQTQLIKKIIPILKNLIITKPNTQLNINNNKAINILINELTNWETTLLNYYIEQGYPKDSKPFQWQCESSNLMHLLLAFCELGVLNFYNKYDVPKILTAISSFSNNANFKSLDRLMHPSGGVHLKTDSIPDAQLTHTASIEIPVTTIKNGKNIVSKKLIRLYDIL
jgi:hypothetical protein